MGRPIDADKLWDKRPQLPPGKSEDYAAGFYDCLWTFSRLIRSEPTAFMKEIHEEIKKALESNYKALSQFDVSDELRHLVQGRISALRGIDDFITELEEERT